MQRGGCRIVSRILPFVPHCRGVLQPGLQRALADRRRTARAEVALYADITRLRESERWKEPDFLDKLKDTYLTRKEIETADLHTWQDVLQWRGDLEHMPSGAGARDVEVDVRVPDWSYLFRADHKVFVYPTEYANSVVVTTRANFSSFFAFCCRDFYVIFRLQSRGHGKIDRHLTVYQKPHGGPASESIHSLL